MTNNISDLRREAFMKNGQKFTRIMESIKEDREIFDRFYQLSLKYENAYVPLAFFLKMIGGWCKRERAKLDSRLEVMQKICDIYTSVCAINQENIVSKGTENVTRLILENLVEIVLKNKQQMENWHESFKNGTLQLNDVTINAEGLRRELL